MGNSSSNVFKEFNVYLLRNIKRKTRKFNAIPRAEKVLEQEKPTRAPLHDSTKKIVEKLIKEHPEKLQEVVQKDEHLYKNLEKVYVTSEGKNTQIFSEEKLPDSYRYQVMKMNLKEDEVPEGKFNSTRAEHFLAANERDSTIYSAEILADVYKIDKKAMENITEYVKVYSVCAPAQKAPKPGLLQQLAQDVIPNSMLEEPEIRYTERKYRLAKHLMARLYSKSSTLDQSKKLIYDMNLLETLATLKPFGKTLKKDMMQGLTGYQSIEELKTEMAREFYESPEEKLRETLARKHAEKYEKEKAEMVVRPEAAEKASVLQKTKMKLEKIGLLETEEEKDERLKGQQLFNELKRDYINPNEVKYEKVYTPEDTIDGFAKQTQQRLKELECWPEDQKLLTAEEKKLLTGATEDSAEGKDTKSESSKAEYKKKISDKV